VALFSNVLQKLASHILAPNQKTSSFSSHYLNKVPVRCFYLSTFARVLLHNDLFFFSFFQSARELPSQIDPTRSIFGDFFEIWTEKIDEMSPQMRKLSALSLCNLLSLNDTQILGFLASILSLEYVYQQRTTQ